MARHLARHREVTMNSKQTDTEALTHELPATLVEGLVRLARGEFSYRIPRSMHRDQEDNAAFFFNAIADELERLLEKTRAHERDLTTTIEKLSQALMKVAAGDYSVEVSRDYSGDAADVLAYLVNTTISEIRVMVAESHRSAEEEKLRLEQLVEKRTEELKILASTDALTGTMNRHQFFKLIEEESARSSRYRHPLSIAMLDLDHFKEINDNYGHTVGDDALRLTAEAIRNMLRQQDSICRYGGEEFVVLMPETDANKGFEVLERVRSMVSGIELNAGGKKVPLSISIGVTPLHPDETVEHAVQRADAAMYQAKAAGRNRVILSP